MTWWEPTDGYLAHHGIKGQKWGIRRYQNPDGSLTAIGKARYNATLAKDNKFFNDVMSDKSLSFNQKRYKVWEYDDKVAEQRRSKLGEDIARRVEDTWDETIGNIYWGRYQNFKSSGEAKKAYEKGKAEVERLNKEFSNQWDKAYSDFMQEKENRNAIQRIKDVIKNGHQKKRAYLGDVNKKLTLNEYKELRKKVTNSDEFKKRQADYSEAEKALRAAKKQFELEYKQASLDEILKSVPKNKQDAVYDYITSIVYDLEQ